MKQFLAHFLPGNAEGAGAGSSTMIALGGGSVETDQSHVRNTRPFEQPGTLNLLTVTVTANTLSGNGTLRTGLGSTGATPGNCSVTFAATQTGTLTDDSNSDDVATDDLYSFVSAIEAGTGSLDWQRIGIVWEPDSGSISLLGANFSSSLGIANNGTVFVTANGARTANATESNTQQIVTAGGTWRHLGVGVATITLESGTFTFRARINGADGNQVLALDFQDELAFFKDDSNTDLVETGDLICLSAVTADSPGSGSGGTNYEWFSSQINHSANESLLLTNGDRKIVDNAATLYFAAGGQTNGSATESAVQQSIRFDANSSHFGAFCSQSGGGDMAVALRINGADANQSVFIDVSALSPDKLVDDSNTDEILATDELSIRATVPESPSGNCRLQSTSLRLVGEPENGGGGSPSPATAIPGVSHGRGTSYAKGVTNGRRV